MKFSDIEGKTIKEARQVKREDSDDTGWLMLEFTDGSKCVIVASYGSYTGESEDEYPTGIGISDSVSGFEYCCECDSLRCTDSPCKGNCGCQKCHDDYGDFLSCE